MTGHPIEQRTTSGTVELRAAGGSGVIGGYALKYNTLSQNLGGYVETCAAGLVDKSLADGLDVLCRYQHDSNMLLGRVSSETLRLSTDNTGLVYDADLPETDYASNVRALAARGDLKYSSFAFRTLDDEWGFTGQGFPLRTLRAIQLVDVAPVVEPAYLDTSTGLRSLAEQRGLDMDDVTKAAKANSLGELLRGKDPVIIDLAPSGQGDSRGQGDTHPLLSLRQRRAALMEKRRTF